MKLYKYYTPATSPNPPNRTVRYQDEILDLLVLASSGCSVGTTGPHRLHQEARRHVLNVLTKPGASFRSILLKITRWQNTATNLTSLSRQTGLTRAPADVIFSTFTVPGCSADTSGPHRLHQNACRHVLNTLQTLGHHFGDNIHSEQISTSIHLH